MNAQIGWTAHQKMVEPTHKKISKITDKLVELKEAGKRGTPKYNALLTQAIELSISISEDYQEFIGYFNF